MPGAEPPVRRAQMLPRPGRRFDGLVGDPLALEDVLEEGDGAALVAGRVRRVDPQVLLQSRGRPRQSGIVGLVLQGRTGGAHGRESCHGQRDRG